MNILITGGLGFIFSHVVEYFASKKGHNIFVVDNMFDGSCKELLEEWKLIDNLYFYKKDINYIQSIHSPNAWGDSIPFPRNIDIIIHAAAESNVDKSIRDSRAFISSNVNGTYAILEYVRNNHPNLKQFLYVNTDEVYGPVEEKTTPNSILKPSNPYAASKAAAGHFCWAFHNTYGMPMQEIRMCNIIGNRQAKTKLLPRVLFCLENRREIPVYDGGDFTREYMDVRDVGVLIDMVLKDNRCEIYNLTFNQELSVNDVIRRAAKIIGKKAITTQSSRQGHDSCYRMVPHQIVNSNWPLNREPYIFEETVKWMV